MNPRERRLTADLTQMQESAARQAMTFETQGNPPDEYEVTFEAKGIALEDQRIVGNSKHQCHVYLHKDYPRRPPVITWKSPIYHPNILGPERNGGVCIGSWSPSESLSDLIDRIEALVSYRSFSLDDALDTDAAEWIRRSSLAPGFDIDGVLGSSAVDREEPVKIEVRG